VAQTPPPSSPSQALSAPPTPAFRPADWETLYTGLPEATRLGPLVRIRYNRVDGPALHVGGAVVNEREPRPLLYAAVGFAFSRERFLYDVGFEAPLGDRRRFRVNGSAYRRTATQDGWIVGETENTFFALFARTDYRDHYEAEGIDGSVTWEPGRDFALGVGAASEDVRSLDTETKFSIFGKDDHFRPNPAIQDGKEGVLSLFARIGPSPIPVDGGTKGELTYERAGSPIDGDSEYGRLRGAANTRLRLTPRQVARARAIGGATVDGDLPPQKVWHVGGIGTLRGHEYKKFSGDQFLLANAEYYLLARKNVWAFAFLDWGAAWFGRDNLSRQRFAFDGGVGIRLGEGPIAVTAARNLQRSDAPILVGVRLGGSF
jgi:outer membrane protein assembly factor BamA